MYLINGSFERCFVVIVSCKYICMFLKRNLFKLKIYVFVVFFWLDERNKLNIWFLCIFDIFLRFFWFVGSFKWKEFMYSLE